MYFVTPKTMFDIFDYLESMGKCYGTVLMLPLRCLDIHLVNGGPISREIKEIRFVQGKKFHGEIICSEWSNQNGNFATFHHITLHCIFTKNIARIANAVQCHNRLSGNKDCHEFRFSIVCICN